jgi:hypothetical protein
MAGMAFVPTYFHVWNSLKFRLLPKNYKIAKLLHWESISKQDTKEQVQRPKDMSQCLQFSKLPLGSAKMVAKKV